MRGGEIVDEILPDIVLSHPRSREQGFPDRSAPNKVMLAVPGNIFSIFIVILVPLVYIYATWPIFLSFKKTLKKVVSKRNFTCGGGVEL